MKEDAMRHEPPVNAAQAVWQNQRREPLSMPLAQIREKSQRLRERTRRHMIAFYVLTLVILVPFAAIVAGATETRYHLGFGLFIAGTLYFTYQTHRRFW